ncbi:MAG: hypothetical protein FJ261_04430 [Planctomycetes bacterium]|nr:hypothetical protein [Planctomycetota bacterium]
MKINLHRGTALVQESTGGLARKWVEPPAGMNAIQLDAVLQLLPAPFECHADQPAWVVLPASHHILFARHRREGNLARIEAWLVRRADYLACEADSPAIIRALESNPMAETAQLHEVARTAAGVQNILKDGEAPTLLGAAQLLVDGGKLHWAVETPVPLQQMASIWDLLPTRQRALLGWTNYLDSTRHKLAISAGNQPLDGAWAWEQAGDYPEGNYERALHQAAFQRDDETLARLFNRGSRADVLLLGLILLAVLVIGQLMLASTGWKPPPLFRPAAKEISP